jgi:membrane protein implicated in regulation of membrane protease activity
MKELLTITAASLVVLGLVKYLWPEIRKAAYLLYLAWLPIMGTLVLVLFCALFCTFACYLARDYRRIRDRDLNLKIEKTVDRMIFPVMSVQLDTYMRLRKLQDEWKAWSPDPVFKPATNEIRSPYDMPITQTNTVGYYRGSMIGPVFYGGVIQ